MASQTFDLQSMLAALKTMDPQDRKLLVDELENLGAIPQKTTKRAKSSTKRKSAEEKQQLPFNPQGCHARLIKEVCHPGTNIPMWKHSAKTMHLGCVDFQCGAKIMENGLCKDCLDATNKTHTEKACKVNGITPHGLFSEPRPSNPTRTSLNNGKTHQYIWLENTQDDDQYTQYITDPDQPTKKSSRSQEHVDVDWDDVIKTDKFGPVKKDQLKQKLKELNLDTSGKKPDLVDRIKSALLPYDQEPQQSQENHVQEPQQPQENQENHVQEPQEPQEPPENHVEEPTSQEIIQDLTNPDSDLEEEESEDKIINIDNVKYIVRDGSIYDINTNREMADEDETDPEEWGRKSRTLHKENIEKEQSDL
jgi:hypothetical protein